MEDAHTISLNLDEGQNDSNTFFAVYDGHGGMSFTLICPYPRPRPFAPEGAAAAKYAGEHVHKKLTSDEAYQRKEYRAALKNAFLRTDDDMRHGESRCVKHRHPLY